MSPEPPLAGMGAAAGDAAETPTIRIGMAGPGALEARRKVATASVPLVIDVVFRP